LGFTLGALAGAVASLLLAPQTGEETRQVIKEKAIELKDKSTESFEDTKKKAEQAYKDALAKAEELSSVTKAKADELAATAKEKAAGATRTAKVKLEETAKKLDEDKPAEGSAS
jgi:gas vesicle protein